MDEQEPQIKLNFDKKVPRKSYMNPDLIQAP